MAVARNNSSLFDKNYPSFEELMISNPDKFMQMLLNKVNWESAETAAMLDGIDPLKFTSKEFDIHKLIPFAGHSLGPLFLPTMKKMNETAELQKKLHDGHFQESHPDGKDNGHWFDCDKHKPSLAAVKELMGFVDDREFVFTASGLSANLGMLMDTFYRPNKQDWHKDKNKIIMLGNEFYSDQAIAMSVLKRGIIHAESFNCFYDWRKPEPEELLIKIPSDENGIYSTENIIRIIRENTNKTQMILLSDVVFNTGQRLDLHKIFLETGNIIKENKIIVGLDLAHSIGNRKIDLQALPVTFAVGCGYKHLSGPAGSGFGIYVNLNADLKKYPPLQGWKAADSNKVFPTITKYNKEIMETKGAVAFRTSNPPPMALIPVQTYLSYFKEVGFDKCMNKSECLTRYMIELLKLKVGDKIDFITPLDSKQRGAMIVIRIKNLTDTDIIEKMLKTNKRTGRFEIDTRKNLIRLTPHYGYTSFSDINAMVNKLKLGIENQAEHGMRAKL